MEAASRIAQLEFELETVSALVKDKPRSAPEKSKLKQDLDVRDLDGWLLPAITYLFRNYHRSTSYPAAITSIYALTKSIPVLWLGDYENASPN